MRGAVIKPELIQPELIQPEMTRPVSSLLVSSFLSSLSLPTVHKIIQLVKDLLLKVFVTFLLATNPLHPNWKQSVIRTQFWEKTHLTIDIISYYKFYAIS